MIDQKFKLRTRVLAEPYEVAEFIMTLQRLRRYWTEWHPPSFYTLGAGIYLYPDSTEQYHQHARRLNPILWSNLESLYSIVLQALSGLLGATVSFHWDLALPGFHIFDYSNVKSFAGGKAHIDFQFKSLKPLVKFDESPANHVTVILPIQIPRFGSGLDIWDLSVDDFQKAREFGESEDEVLAGTNRLYVPYVPGELVVFRSELHHGMAPISMCTLGDRRITLQAHCAWLDGGWILYW